MFTFLTKNEIDNQYEIGSLAIIQHRIDAFLLHNNLPLFSPKTKLNVGKDEIIMLLGTVIFTEGYFENYSYDEPKEHIVYNNLSFSLKDLKFKDWGMKILYEGKIGVVIASSIPSVDFDIADKESLYAFKVTFRVINE